MTQGLDRIKNRIRTIGHPLPPSPDPIVPAEEVQRALQPLFQGGKVRAVGAGVGMAAGEVGEFETSTADVVADGD
jgi:aryl-alcohol dehydrogenase-like predicted oxidoreductase